MIRQCLCLFLLLLIQQYADGAANSEPSAYQTVVKNESIILDISNEIKIIEQPSQGVVKLNDDNEFVYQPNAGVCGEIDYFNYVTIGDHQVDTTTVYVEILCETLTFLSGFEPDGEDAPTTFTIVGVEQFPNNTLSVFNDSGNQVYYKKGYLNDWDGQNEGKPLPENLTYFYVFNDGVGRTYTGYLHID